MEKAFLNQEHTLKNNLYIRNSIGSDTALTNSSDNKDAHEIEPTLNDEDDTDSIDILPFDIFPYPSSNNIDNHMVENVIDMERPTVGHLESNQTTQHGLFNESKKPFQCDTCGKTFNRTSQLIAHIRTHTGKKNNLAHSLNR